MRTWKRGPVGLLTAAILIGASSMMVKSDAVKRLAFSAPAAHLAGVLSGAPCVKDGDDYRLVGPNLDLTVVPACAAADYFCLMTGFLSLLAIWRGFTPRTQLLVLPSAWIATILINALRLNACWQTDRLAQTLLPPSLWPATHMAVGIVTFLVGMVGVYWAVCRIQGSAYAKATSDMSGFRVQETELAESGLTLSKQNTLSPELQHLNPEP